MAAGMQSGWEAQQYLSEIEQHSQPRLSHLNNVIWEMEVRQICRDRIDEDDNVSNIVILPGRDLAHKSCYEENQMYEDYV